MRTTPLMAGMVTWRKRCHTLAPSMAAASWSSCGTAWRPARIVMPKKGMPRQMLARHTEEIARLGPPRKLMFCLDDPQVFQKPGDRAEDGIEDHEPAEGTQGGGHDPGHHHRRPDGVAEADAVVQDQRHGQAQGRLEGNGNQGINESVPRGLEKDAVGNQVGEVAEADVFAQASDDAVGQGQPDAQEKRVGHEDHQQERPRQHEDDPQAGLALQQGLQGEGPLAGLNNFDWRKSSGLSQ